MTKVLLTLSLAAVLFAGSATTKADEVAEITLTADKIQFIYDIKEFTVKPGQKVKLTLINPADSVTRQPHNVLIVKPGKKDVVGMAANNAMADPNFLTTKQAVPDSDSARYCSSRTRFGSASALNTPARSAARSLASSSHSVPGQQTSSAGFTVAGWVIHPGYPSHRRSSICRAARRWARARPGGVVSPGGAWPG